MKNLLAVLGLCGFFGITLNSSAISITVLVDSPNQVVFDVLWPVSAPSAEEQAHVHGTSWDMLVFDEGGPLEVNASNIGGPNPIQIFASAAVTFASPLDRSANDAVVTPLGAGLDWTTIPGNSYELQFSFEIKAPDRGPTFALLGLGVLFLGGVRKLVFA